MCYGSRKHPTVIRVAEIYDYQPIITLEKFFSGLLIRHTANSRSLYRINHLTPTVYAMHQQFNIQQLYALPTLYLRVLYLSENK